MNFSVHTPVFVIYITEQVRANHRMIQSRIENGLFVVGSSGNVYPSHFGIPAGHSLHQSFIELRGRHFSLYIFPGPFVTSSRDSY